MGSRPGQVTVTTEVAFCSFCGRPRTLRREERQLGDLVRTVITCESCHRTLSNQFGTASSRPQPAEAAPPSEAEPAARPVPAPSAAAAAETPRRRSTKRVASGEAATATTKRAASKPAAGTKPAAGSRQAKPKPAPRAAATSRGETKKGSSRKP